MKSCRCGTEMPGRRGWRGGGGKGEGGKRGKELFDSFIERMWRRQGTCVVLRVHFELIIFIADYILFFFIVNIHACGIPTNSQVGWVINVDL
jgi:hypothetical protein